VYSYESSCKRPQQVLLLKQNKSWPLKLLLLLLLLLLLPLHDTAQTVCRARWDTLASTQQHCHSSALQGPPVLVAVASVARVLLALTLVLELSHALLVLLVTPA
jgi:hypothetical protein